MKPPWRGPWVSRVHYEGALASIAHLERNVLELRALLERGDRERDMARDAAQRAEVRYQALVDRLIEMKREGFHKPETPLKAPERDPVTQAIIARSRGNQALTSHYVRYTAEQRALGVPEGDIAQSILAGESDIEEGTL